MQNWRFFTLPDVSGQKRRRWHWQYKDERISDGRSSLGECLADAKAHGFDQRIVYITDKAFTPFVPRKVCVVVEDNVDAAETMAMILAGQGHAVTVAFDGAEGLALDRHRHRARGRAGTRRARSRPW